VQISVLLPLRQEQSLDKSRHRCLKHLDCRGYLSHQITLHYGTAIAHLQEEKMGSAAVPRCTKDYLFL